MAMAIAPVSAQYKWDIGLHLGGANYLGEMGGMEKTRRDFVWDMKLGQTRWAVGPFARYKINRTISVNGGLLYMRIQGADALSTNRERVGRNLNFRNDMFEFYVRPEFTIFQDNDLGGRGRYRTDFRLFAYVGAALYYSNPKGQINRTGEFYALQPLQTELVDYSQIGFAIPAGIGFHFTKQRRHRFGMDLGLAHDLHRLPGRREHRIPEPGLDARRCGWSGRPTRRPELLCHRIGPNAA